MSPSQSLLHFLTLATLISGNGLNIANSSKSSVTTAFIFGDSTVDSGNNNNLRTYFKCNHRPYGVDFLNGNHPNGRFSNGRIATDFIASYAKVKENIPPYLHPNLTVEDLITGVSFASGGAGYDPFTARRNSVINLTTQLHYFDEYKNKLQQMIGKEKVDSILETAAFVVSCGTNDIVYRYGIIPYWSPFPEGSISSYIEFLINRCKWFLQELKNRGARRIAVVGLPPLGCLPIIITFHTVMYIQRRKCIQYMSRISRVFNQKLERELKAMQAYQPNITLAYGNIYAPLRDQINHPHKYGFEVVDKGCCGTGIIEGGRGCNFLSTICKDRSKYVFWDAMHPTERSYYLLFEALRPVIDFVIKN